MATSNNDGESHDLINAVVGAPCRDAEMEDAPTEDTGHTSQGLMGFVPPEADANEGVAALKSKPSAGSLTENSSASPSRAGRWRRNRQDTIIRIVSASYGPYDGRRLLHGEICNSEATRIPYTRDVTPIIRALLETRGCTGPVVSSSGGLIPSSPSSSDQNTPVNISSDDEYHPRVHMLAEGNLRRRVAIPIMDGKSMNALFGDPCPGTTKCLRVIYVFCDEEHEVDLDGGGNVAKNLKICRSSFQEHERVVLRRAVTFYQDEARLKRAVAVKKERKSASSTRTDSTKKSEEKKAGENEEDFSVEKSEEDDEASTMRWARRMGRSQSITEMVDAAGSPLRSPLSSSSSLTGLSMITEGVESANVSCLKDKPAQKVAFTSGGAPKWRLRSATSEIVLPITLPYLDIRQRALCQLVCKCWRFVVRQIGVAQTVDANDSSFKNFTASFLRGIMAHSYSSLAQLFLNDFVELKPGDLHPAIPHLRKLRTLDISRCEQLDDTTLVLLSQNVSRTLQVLYMKGLRRISDEGLIAICQTCHKLRVLEISNVPITDESGAAIGHNLRKLEALYMRDNFQLTNRSIDVITEKCSKLTQLTLWGCTRMSHLRVGSESISSTASPLSSSGCDKLVLLNLWGCHSLVDDAANSMGALQNLRSLIVSECHRLTDTFVVNLAMTVPHIHHLYLRYVRRITNASVYAIADSMHHISSLDLSFCTKIAHHSLVYLLETRYKTLSELRLYSCHQLDMTVPRQQQSGRVERDGGVGQLLLNAIRSHSQENCLSIIDVRECKSQPRRGAAPRGDDSVFIMGMTGLRFEQRLPGFFVRPARWNADVRKRLVQQMMVDAGAA